MNTKKRLDELIDAAEQAEDFKRAEIQRALEAAEKSEEDARRKEFEEKVHTWLGSELNSLLQVQGIGVVNNGVAIFAGKQHRISCSVEGDGRLYFFFSPSGEALWKRFLISPENLPSFRHKFLLYLGELRQKYAQKDEPTGFVLGEPRQFDTV